MNAFLFLQGLETLPIRMERHNSNAGRRRRLSGPVTPAVAKTIYPGLMDGEERRRADAYLDGAATARLWASNWAEGARAGRKFIDALELFFHVANIGDARSLAIHPATTTHSQLSEEEQAATGVTPGYVRLSIGLEHIDDILADLDQALAAAG